MKLSAFTFFLKQELKELFEDRELHNHIYLLFEYYLKLNRAQVLLNQEMELSDKEYKLLLGAVDQLKRHKPIDYILNQSVFFGREFYVDENVLIPRSETEELVQWILEDEVDKSIEILDIGSGSGCIPISLKLEGAFASVSGVDISKEANLIAERNAELLQADISIDFMDILSNAPKHQYDVVVSNPPYVKEEELQQLDKKVVEYEPLIALAPKGDPLTFYKRMIAISPQLLRKGGRFYWEIHEELGEAVVSILKQSNFQQIELRQDIYGRDRLVKAIYS